MSDIRMAIIAGGVVLFALTAYHIISHKEAERESLAEQKNNPQRMRGHSRDFL